MTDKTQAEALRNLQTWLMHIHAGTAAMPAGDTLKVWADALATSAPGAVERAAPASQRCACGEKLASECDEEWGPNCDLGNNPARAQRAPDDVQAAVAAVLGSPAPSAAPAEPIGWVNSANVASARISRERGGPFDCHSWAEARTMRHDTPIYLAAPHLEAAQPVSEASEASEAKFDDNAALREMAKHAHRALNAAANILTTLDEDMIGDESVEGVRKRCAGIACSLFTLLRGNEIDRYESAPFASSALAAQAPQEPAQGQALPAAIRQAAERAIEHALETAGVLSSLGGALSVDAGMDLFDKFVAALAAHPDQTSEEQSVVRAFESHAFSETLWNGGRTFVPAHEVSNLLRNWLARATRSGEGRCDG